jgi:hypothetical protein
MSRQATLSKYGFNTPKTGRLNITIKKEKGRSMNIPFVRGDFVRHGNKMNINGTIECGIWLDGSTREYTQKLKRIIKWSSTRPKFDITVYEGILDNTEFTKCFSSRQREAIDNCYYKFDVFMYL